MNWLSRFLTKEKQGPPHAKAQPQVMIHMKIWRAKEKRWEELPSEPLNGYINGDLYR